MIDFEWMRKKAVFKDTQHENDGKDRIFHIVIFYQVNHHLEGQINSQAKEYQEICPTDKKEAVIADNFSNIHVKPMSSSFALFQNIFWIFWLDHTLNPTSYMLDILYMAHEQSNLDI